MDLSRLEQLLARFSSLRLIVYGDYFLDDYLDLDRALSEPSVETGLEAYQVVGTRKYPGAAGTVSSNLRALGVGVLAVGLYGDDGSGYELHRRLVESGVDVRGMLRVSGYATPTYMKPMLREPDGQVHELNRMDIKNRRPLDPRLEDQLIAQLERLLPEANGVLVIDQVAERNCGVVTDRVRQALRRMSANEPGKVMIADSRAFLGEFTGLTLKSNITETARAAGKRLDALENTAACAEDCGRLLSRRTGRPVIITLGSEGMLLISGPEQAAVTIPAVQVDGPIDIVGAGDSVNAAVGAALCAGATLTEAGQIASLVASIVIQQIGVTGSATPQQVVQQFQQNEALL